jgi:hypothetical protein
MAWAASILGIVGLVFSWIPFLDILTMLGALVGVVLGVIAVFGSHRTAAGIGVGLCVLAVVISSSVTSRVSSALDTASPSVSSGSDNDGGGYAPAPVAPPLPAGPATTFTDGTYVPGTDIVPGTYRTSGPAPGAIELCYWSRMKDTSGDFGAIIANDIAQGPSTVTIRTSDGAFKTSGCNVWQKIG